MDSVSHDILVAARERIAGQEFLGKGTFHNPFGVMPDSLGTDGVRLGQAGCTCAGLAISFAAGDIVPGDGADAWDAEMQAQSSFVKTNNLKAEHYKDPLSVIAWWNDDPARTKQDVLDAFDKAIAAHAAVV